MIRSTTSLARTARRFTILVVPLLVVATGTAAAHGSGSGGGGMMGGGWGVLGGAMGLWGLLWMGVLIAVPLFLVFALVGRGSGSADDEPLTVLRERYARGELSDEEFERGRERLTRTR